MKTSSHRQQQLKDHAGKVFGRRKAWMWMATPHAAVGGYPPFIAIQENKGAARVERILRQEDMDQKMIAVFGRKSIFRMP